MFASDNWIRKFQAVVVKVVNFGRHRLDNTTSQWSPCCSCTRDIGGGSGGGDEGEDNPGGDSSPEPPPRRLGNVGSLAHDRGPSRQRGEAPSSGRARRLAVVKGPVSGIGLKISRYVPGPRR